MEIVNFIDGLLIGMLVVILITKIRNDKKMVKSKSIILTKEQTEKILESMLEEVKNDGIPIERDEEDE